MATRSEIVVTLDGEVTDGARPLVFADEPMFARGDGVFETLLIRCGRVCLLEDHLARLVNSAAVIGLPAPDLARWRYAAGIAVEHWSGAGDAVLRLSYGRGRGTAPTAFATVSDVPARVLAARRDGVSAMTVDRGMAVATPWSMTGAKSLSYAVYSAALRHAEGNGFGDAVLVSSDGYVLEGTRSSVVISDADGVLVTPPSTMPILPGTTVQALFGMVRRRGGVCQRRALRIPDLVAAQGVWLLSSVTLTARVHTLDDVALPAGPMATEMAALVDEAVTQEA